MQPLFRQLSLCLLILILGAGQAAAFDFQIGPLHMNAPSHDRTGQYQNDNVSMGAMLTIPFGIKTSGPTAHTLNGQDIAMFTQEDARDSLVVIMLFGVAIAAGVLTVSAAAK